MTSLLLELYVEEIPAMMQQNAEIAYAEIFHNALQAENITYSGLETYIGPRRITLHVSGIATVIPSKTIELKGPRINAPDAAIQGFCKSNNVLKDNLIVRNIKDQDCYVYEKHIPEQGVHEILPDIINTAISTYTWPKSMSWGTYETKFVRPIKNILCLFDDKILPVTYGHLKANNMTFGHRFMHFDAIVVNGFDDYKTKLLENMVVLSRLDRVQMIEDGLRRLVGDLLVLSDDPKLLEEVAGLVEYSTILMGRIPERFMHVPKEVLITAMRQHQRYFTVQNADGSFAPYFLFATNILTDDHNEIIQGNERVLSARLSDAEYFFTQDKKTTLESRIAKLERLIFHAKLGSMKDKVLRLQQIAIWIDQDNYELHQAALLCKCDLVTEVVGEFPELQGIIGGYYATLDGLSDNISDAIRSHYKPEGVDDVIPVGTGALLALVDKVDSLVSLYVAGERSSGSKDPYALRRYALSIIRIILLSGIKLDIVQFVTYAATLHSADKKLVSEVLEFIEERLKQYMLKTYEHNLVGATINLATEPDIVIAAEKLHAIDQFLKTTEGESLLTCYRRASSILKDGIAGDVVIDQSLLTLEPEKILFDRLAAVSAEIDPMLFSKNFKGALQLFLTLLAPVNRFFDDVTVMDVDKDIATNRLALLHAIVREFHKLARFDEL